MIQGNPSCEATPFASEKWPFQRGWPLVRVAFQKGFHCTMKYLTTVCKPRTRNVLTNANK